MELSSVSTGRFFSYRELYRARTRKRTARGRFELKLVKQQHKTPVRIADARPDGNYFSCLVRVVRPRSFPIADVSDGLWRNYSPRRPFEGVLEAK
jgi:hypothetical protein